MSVYHSRPATHDDVSGWWSGTRMIWHTRCSVMLRTINAKAWCPMCQACWSADVLYRFDAQDIADRFSVLEYQRDSEERLVWITTGGNEHTGTIVGSNPADVRGVLNDGRAWRAYV